MSSLSIHVEKMASCVFMCCASLCGTGDAPIYMLELAWCRLAWKLSCKETKLLCRSLSVNRTHVSVICQRLLPLSRRITIQPAGLKYTLILFNPSAHTLPVHSHLQLLSASCAVLMYCVYLQSLFLLTTYERRIRQQCTSDRQSWALSCRPLTSHLSSQTSHLTP